MSEEYKEVLDDAMFNHGMAVLEVENGFEMYAGHYGLDEPNLYKDLKSLVKSMVEWDGWDEDIPLVIPFVISKEKWIGLEIYR